MTEMVFESLYKKKDLTVCEQDLMFAIHFSCQTFHSVTLHGAANTPGNQNGKFRQR